MEERNVSLHFRRKYTESHANRMQWNIYFPLYQCKDWWSVEWIGRWPIKGMQTMQGRAYAMRQSMSKGCRYRYATQIFRKVVPAGNAPFAFLLFFAFPSPTSPEPPVFCLPAPCSLSHIHSKLHCFVSYWICHDVPWEDLCNTGRFHLLSCIQPLCLTTVTCLGLRSVSSWPLLYPYEYSIHVMTLMHISSFLWMANTSICLPFRLGRCHCGLSFGLWRWNNPEILGIVC